MMLAIRKVWNMLFAFVLIFNMLVEVQTQQKLYGTCYTHKAISNWNGIY